jgi:hypothetical protein
MWWTGAPGDRAAQPRQGSGEIFSNTLGEIVLPSGLDRRRPLSRDNEFMTRSVAISPVANPHDVDRIAVYPYLEAVSALVTRWQQRK